MRYRAENQVGKKHRIYSPAEIPQFPSVPGNNRAFKLILALGKATYNLLRSVKSGSP